MSVNSPASTYPTLAPKALELAKAFHLKQRQLATGSKTGLIQSAKGLGIEVYQSNDLPVDVFARVSLQEAKVILTLNKKGHLVRKRFMVAKVMARKLLETPNEKFSGDIELPHCTLRGSDSLENQTACALLVSKSDVLAAYVLSSNLANFAQRFTLNTLCAELLLASYLGDSAVQKMKEGTLSSVGALRPVSKRPSCEKDTDWTGEIVSLGIGAAISSLIGF